MFAVCVSVFSAFNLQVWLVNVGFSITYGSLFAKTWRLHKIFNSASLQVQVIPDSKLLAAVGLLVVFDLVVMGIWRIVSPWGVLENPLGACSAGPYGEYFEIILLAQKGALTVGGSILIYLVKALPVKFNESKHLAGTLYNTLLVSIVYISVVLGLGEQLSRSSRAIMSSALTIYGAACAVVLVVGPKLLQIFSESKASDAFVALDDDKRGAPTKATAAAAAQGKAGAVQSIETQRLALRNEYDVQCRKLKATEDQLEKQSARIQELRAAMIDNDQALSHLHSSPSATASPSQSPPSSELHSQIELLA